MGQNLSYLVRMPKYGHIVFCSQLSQFVSNFDKTYKHVFRRLLATSRAPHSMVLSMLRRFGKIGPKINQIWAWLSRGHRWAPRVRNPLKSSFMGHSLLVNCYLEIKFHKKSKRYFFTQIFYKHLCFWSSTSSNRKYKWCKCTVLRFQDTLVELYKALFFLSACKLSLLQVQLSTSVEVSCPFVRTSVMHHVHRKCRLARSN